MDYDEYFDRLDKMHEECEKKLQALLLVLEQLQQGESNE